MTPTDLKHLEKLKEVSPLGKTVSYNSAYDPNLLFPIPRAAKRKEIGVANPLPFFGVDIWNAYELSWLNPKGKPEVALATIEVPCDSINIFESKSLKLYLNSLNSTRFTNSEEILQILRKDLSFAVSAEVNVYLQPLQTYEKYTIQQLPGLNIDNLDIEIETYQPEAKFLKTLEYEVSEELNSHLLKSNCLVTNQPDWGSLYLCYTGKQIDHAGLLKYIISLREHNEFHEQCVERIFMHLLQQCQPNSLTVYARYTRRGGIDINPFRSTEKNFSAPNIRLIRQ